MKGGQTDGGATCEGVENAITDRSSLLVRRSPVPETCVALLPCITMPPVADLKVFSRAQLTKLNIPKGDDGGELDPHGADGLGNPIGGLVFTNARGKAEQLAEWTSFMSDDEYCLRGCFGLCAFPSSRMSLSARR